MLSIRASVIACVMGLAFVFATTLPSHAQMPKPAIGAMTHTPLTQKLVRQFLGTVDDFNTLSKKYKSERPSRRGSPMSFLSDVFRHQGARAEMSRVLSSHGFADIQNWMQVARTVMLTYGFAKSGKSLAKANQDIQRSLDKVRNNPNISEQQRAMILKSLGPALAQFKQMRPTPENLALVKTMQTEIAAKMDRKKPKR